MAKITIQKKIQKMKKIIFASFALLLLLNSCDDGFGLFDSSKRIVGKGAVEKQERDAKDFKGIDLMVSGNVFVKQGSNYKVTVEAQKNILDVVETVVENGILRLKFKEGSWNMNFDKLNFYIETPSVSSLKISGSGDMTVESAFNSDDLDLNVSGSGNIKMPNGITVKTLEAEIGGSGDINLTSVSAEQLSAKVLGSGNFEINGSGNKAKFEVTGSGDIAASDFKTKATEAHTTGSGNIKCFATESLDAHILGSGDIHCGGNPPSVQSRTTGSGEIITK